jgi:isopentenyldiphosphate isomerase
MIPEILQFIILKTRELNRIHIKETVGPINYAAIFCQHDDEYRKLFDEASQMGKIVEDTPTGPLFKLKQPISTLSGPLHLLKIRKPDPTRPQRGDADFNLPDYYAFKAKYIKDTEHFKLIDRGHFEMMELRDPSFQVLSYFSNIPLTLQLGIGKKHGGETRDGIILNIVDQDDRVIGLATRKEIHEKGLLHREIHVWFITPKGEIIFQHRAKDKDTYPDLLDATVGGHVEIGDNYEKTALKEMEEETGVHGNPQDIHLMKKFLKRSEDKVTGMINNTIRAQYAYVYPGKVDDLRVEEGKALGFEAWPIDQLSRLSDEDRKKFIPLILEPDMLALFQRMKALLGG